MGPEGDDAPSVQQWRGFWLDKSQLRRFRDGRIVEACIWSAGAEEDAAAGAGKGSATIVDRIVRWVLTAHGGVADDAVRCVGWQLDDVMRARQLLSAAPPTFSSPSLSPSAASSQLQSAFTVLSTQLKALRSLPLSFTTIQAIHPAFRSADPFPPLPHASFASSPAWPVVPVLAHFESSSQWPASLYAVQQIKSAFYIHIATALSSPSPAASSSSPSSASAPLPPTSVVSFTHLDLVTRPQHFVFRLYLQHHREPSSVQHDLHIAVRGFASTHAHFSAVVTVVKRWLAAHLFSPAVNDWMAEMAVIGWLQQQQQALPTNPTVLLTLFLSWLSTFPFAFTPLIVRLKEDTDARALEERLMALYHKARPAPPLFIASDVDEASSIVGGNVTLATVRRLQAYAAAGSGRLTQLLTKGAAGLALWMSVFKTDLRPWDLVVHVRPAVLGHQHLQQSVHRVEDDGAHAEPARKRYKPPIDEGKDGAGEQECLLGVDVLRAFVQRVETQLGWYAEVGADYCGGQVVVLRLKEEGEGEGGGRWSVKDSGYKRVREWQDDAAVLNVEEMVEDVWRIGEGMVDRIDVQGRLTGRVQGRP